MAFLAWTQESQPQNPPKWRDVKNLAQGSVSEHFGLFPLKLDDIAQVLLSPLQALPYHCPYHGQ